MRRILLGVFGWSLLLAGVFAVGCGGLKYPNCDNDEACNTDDHHGVCMQGKCVECRDDAACGKGKACVDGACSAVAGYCDDSKACADGESCGKDHRCAKAPVASHDPTACDDEHACPTGERCQNGHCVAPPKGGPGCTEFSPPKFQFESSDLDPEAKKTLERLAGCLTTGTLKSANVTLVGHCDARGEMEFNMGLGAQRAEVGKVILVGAGVPADRILTVSRGKLDASGTDEAGYANDRRVDIEVR